jgi:nitrate reductase gamma subunit
MLELIGELIGQTAYAWLSERRWGRALMYAAAAAGAAVLIGLIVLVLTRAL